MKRSVVALACLYLLFAIIGRFVERMGAVHCACADGCWCRRPILSAFRWVFPWRHPRIGARDLTGGSKGLGQIVGDRW